jgi:hypothetical protein
MHSKINIWQEGNPKPRGGKCRIAHNLKNLTYEDCNLASDYLCYRIKFLFLIRFNLKDVFIGHC